MSSWRRFKFNSYNYDNPIVNPMITTKKSTEYTLTSETNQNLSKQNNQLNTNGASHGENEGKKTIIYTKSQ